MKQREWLRGAVVALFGLLPAAAQADVFNMGGTRNPNDTWTGLASLEMVPMGNAGNANDTRYDSIGYGGVVQPYMIGKYEITNAQWREFLTAKANVNDPYGLYNQAGTTGGIDCTWSVDHYVYTTKGGDANWDNRPVSDVSFWDAARFCNWLHNGQGNGDTETGAYINIGNQDTFARQPGAKYFIPTEDEWYKAAYYDPNKGGTGVGGYWDYPMLSDSPAEPSNDLTTPDGGNNANFNQSIGSLYYTTFVGEFENSASPYGTFDQGGNLWEWNETTIDSTQRGLRGGEYGSDFEKLHASFRDTKDIPTTHCNCYGFRVASIPEPSSMTLVVWGAVAVFVWRWLRKSNPPPRYRRYKLHTRMITTLPV